MPRLLSTSASVRRRLALGAAALTSLTAAGTVLAPPAQAAWTTGSKMNGVKVQVCKVPLGGGEVRVRVRLDNRASDEVYRGSLMRLSGGSGTVTVRAAGGTISGTKSLVVKPGNMMGTGIGSPRGDHGSAIGYARDLARC